VLLLEAGGSDQRLTVQAPLAYGSQIGKSTDWRFVAEPEPNLTGRAIPQPRGRVLGGTSSMNAMVWVRGARCDYDGWQLPGWSWDDVAPVPPEWPPTRTSAAPISTGRRSLRSPCGRAAGSTPPVPI
jgi:choline dehydrogenase